MAEVTKACYFCGEEGHIAKECSVTPPPVDTAPPFSAGAFQEVGEGEKKKEHPLTPAQAKAIENAPVWDGTEEGLKKFPKEVVEAAARKVIEEEGVQISYFHKSKRTIAVFDKEGKVVTTIWESLDPMVDTTGYVYISQVIAKKYPVEMHEHLNECYIRYVKIDFTVMTNPCRGEGGGVQLISASPFEEPGSWDAY